MLDLQRFPGSGLENVELGQPIAQLGLNPIAGVGLTVPEDHGARGHLHREIHQLFPVCVGGEIEALSGNGA